MPRDGEPVWLIGMMGSGKTTVAPLVARLLDRSWADTDAEVEAATGVTVPELIALSEERFRREEAAVVAGLASGSAVVATGGGAVLGSGAEVISSTGVAIWLRAPVDVLAGRVEGTSGSRPLLGDDPTASLERIGVERGARYEELADAVVDTEGLDPDGVADQVVRAWKSVSSAG